MQEAVWTGLCRHTFGTDPPSFVALCPPGRGTYNGPVTPPHRKALPAKIRTGAALSVLALLGPVVAAGPVHAATGTFTYQRSVGAPITLTNPADGTCIMLSAANRPAYANNTDRTAYLSQQMCGGGSGQTWVWSIAPGQTLSAYPSGLTYFASVAFG